MGVLEVIGGKILVCSLLERTIFFHGEKEFFVKLQSSELTEGSMMHFLDDVKSGKVEPRGGSSFFRKFRRAFHELSKALS